MARRRFDPNFRAGAMRIVKETGRSIALVACELGINAGTLANWLSMDRLASQAPDGRVSESEREALLRLRRKVVELAMERDVLKRSVVLWVKEATK